LFDFTTFHADLAEISQDADVSKLARHIKSEVARTDLIELMGRSAQLFHKTATLTLLTNHGSRLAAPSFARHEYPVAAPTLMLDRMSAQLEYLRAHDFHKPIVLLDTDILLNDSLLPLFTYDFDVALTWREDVRQPINGGLIILNNRRPAKVLQFFSDLLQVYRSRYGDKADWKGDQFAIRDYLGLSVEAIQKSPRLERDGIKVEFLPCDKFNFSPDTEAQSIPARLVGKAVIHFKGPRKRLMRAYWNDHLAPLELQQQPIEPQSFNLDRQCSSAWVDRAEICVDLLRQIDSRGSALAVADIGCGDQKLRDIACRNGLTLRYTGYDVQPQAANVERFDIERDVIDRPVDVAVMLGVIEYVADPRSALVRLAEFAPRLILSHAVRDGDRYSCAELAKLGWRNHLYRVELEALLVETGWTIQTTRETPDSKTWLWAAQRASM
jgi:hypothetical protein